MSEIKFKQLSADTMVVVYTDGKNNATITIPVDKFYSIMSKFTNKILKELPLFDLEPYDANGDDNLPYCLDDDTKEYTKDSNSCVINIGMGVEDLAVDLFGNDGGLMCKDNNLKEYNVANYESLISSSIIMSEDQPGKWEPGDDWHLNNKSTVSVISDGVRKNVSINECSIGSLADLSIELDKQLTYGTFSTFKVDSDVSTSINGLTLLLLLNAGVFYDDPLETIKRIKCDIMDIITDIVDVPKSKEDKLEDSIWQDVECSVYTVLTHSSTY